MLENIWSAVWAFTAFLQTWVLSLISPLRTVGISIEEGWFSCLWGQGKETPGSPSSYLLSGTVAFSFSTSVESADFSRKAQVVFLHSVLTIQLLGESLVQWYSQHVRVVSLRIISSWPVSVSEPT